MSMGEMALDGGQIACVFDPQESGEGVVMVWEEFAFGDEEQSAGTVLHYQIMIKAAQKGQSCSILPPALKRRSCHSPSELSLMPSPDNASRAPHRSSPRYCGCDFIVILEFEMRLEADLNNFEI